MTSTDLIRELATRTRLIGPIRRVRQFWWRALGTLRYAGIKSEDLVDHVRRHSSDIHAWVRLVDLERKAGRLSPESVALIKSHQIESSAYVVNHLADQIAEKAGAKLSELADQPIGGLEAAIEEIVRWKTIIQCRNTHCKGGYFSAAEAVMQFQWDQLIWPVIKDFDFTSVLELACGHGRNTEYLRRYAKQIDLVDVNQTAIDACKLRFGEFMESCRFNYHVTDGNHLHMITDASITLLYSWDSMVHFDKLVVRDYMPEIGRVLQPGGRAFLHHSNYGAFAPNSDWAQNVGTRSDVSAVILRGYAEQCGLYVVSQRLMGRRDGWGMDDLDCISVIEKPATI